MHSYKIILASCLLCTISAQTTKIQQHNVLMHKRAKRYLMFPEKSNFVASLALGLPLLQVQPKGWQITAEIDVPFALPSDTRLFHKKHQQISEKHYHHWRTKRKVWNELKTAFNKTGLDGNACMEKILCEAQNYIHFGSKSMTRDMLTALLNLEGFQGLDCKENKYCNIPFFKYILGSLSSESSLLV